MISFLLSVPRMALWLVVLTAVFVPLERAFALHRQPVLRPQLSLDLAYYFLNSVVTGAALALPTALLATALHRMLPAPMLTFASGLPFWARLLAGFVVGEIGFYWGHRWSHAIPWLWRFHAVHHSAEQLDFLSNTRAHPIDMVVTRLCGFVPLYALGLAHGGAGGTLVPALVTLVGTVWGYFIHANLRWRFGPLEWLIATPAFHHWHHTNDVFRDRNYAAMLPLLDRVFGTWHLPAAWPPCYGIDGEMSPRLGGQLFRPLVADQPASATKHRPPSSVAA